MKPLIFTAMVSLMRKKKSRRNTFIKLTMLCYAVCSLTILNSCALSTTTLYNLTSLEDYDESFTEDESVFYVKVDKNVMIAQLDQVDELEGELELDVIEYSSDEDDELYEINGEENSERVAFLTFDDGPGLNTDRLLDVLYEEEVPAIFFLVGYSINTFPYSEALMERMLDEGHYIGLHTMSHQYYTLYVGDAAPSRFVSEMSELQGLVYDLVDHHTYLCRAAYGMMTGFRPGHFVAVNDAGLKCIDWNIDPQDWQNDAQTIFEEVVQQVVGLNFPSELVIVLHEYEQTAQALPLIIAFLREYGYEFKTYDHGYEFIYYRYRY